MPRKLAKDVEEVVDSYKDTSSTAWRIVSQVESFLAQLPPPSKEDSIVKETKNSSHATPDTFLVKAVDNLRVSDRKVEELLTKHRSFLYRFFHINSRKELMRDIGKQHNDLNKLTERLIEATISRSRPEEDSIILYPSDSTVRFGIGPSKVQNIGPPGRLSKQWVAQEVRNVIGGGSSWSSLRGGQLMLLDKTGVQDVVIKEMVYPRKEAALGLRRTRREREIWSRLDSYDHPNILPFYGTYYQEKQRYLSEEDRTVYFVAPLANGGDLISYMGTQVNEPKDYRFKLLGDIIMGLELLHEGKPPFKMISGDEGKDVEGETRSDEARTQIYHGDLHTGNVLVYLPKSTPNRPIAWLADFGISVHSDQAATCVTHPDFRAPEIRKFEGVPQKMTSKELEKRNIDLLRLLEKGDVFSFGCTAYCLLTEFIYGERFNYNTVLRWTRPDDISEGLYKLVKECCDDDPAIRPTVAEIRKRCNELEVRFEDAENREALGLPKLGE